MKAALHNLNKKYGITELASLFLYPAMKTTFIVGSISAAAVFGGLPVVVGAGIGLAGSLLAVFAAGMASAPQNETMLGMAAKLAIPALIGAGCGGIYAGLGFLAPAVGTALGMAASAAATGLMLFAAERLPYTKPEDEKHQTYVPPSNKNGWRGGSEFSWPARIVRLAATFGVAAAIGGGAYVYKDDAREIPVVKKLYEQPQK